MTTTAEPSLDDQLTALLTEDLDAIQDPYPLYNRLREESPVHRYGSVVLLSRHRDVKAGYRDDTRFHVAPTRRRPFDDNLRLLSEDDLEVLEEVETFERNYLRVKNGPDHDRIRTAVHRYFTPKRAARLEPEFQTIFDELIDERRDREVFDFMEVAAQVPLLVICDLLEVPREDAQRVKHWSDLINPPFLHPLRPESVRGQLEGIRQESSYVRELIERHRSAPERGQLVAAVLDAAQGQRLSKIELVAFFVHTLFAGHETTQHMIGNGLFQLMRHRDQWERLCADPSLAASATEEVMRFDPSVPGSGRMAARDVEVEGVLIEQGTKVQLVSAAANRDPRVFAEPDTFDIARGPNDHLALGFGPHFCIGASFARIEGRIVFGTLAARFPNLELAAAPDTLRYRPGIRGLDSLPVTLG